jgi:hypothetical protein
MVPKGFLRDYSKSRVELGTLTLTHYALLPKGKYLPKHPYKVKDRKEESLFKLRLQ